MKTVHSPLEERLLFEYTSFDRVVLRGYIQGLFIEGSIIHLLRKLGKNWKTAKIAYELRKLRERGAVEKLKSSHYYRLTREGFVWIFYSFFNNKHLLKPLLSGSYIKEKELNVSQASNIELAYSDINKAVSMIMTEF
ncbi:MAG TPA: hypothetical protein ENK75_03740 [Saprospiraceae bacterium]|jgi:hypothetical protein|nr:hypothetical protein [Saprospiraceae bacterium]